MSTTELKIRYYGDPCLTQASRCVVAVTASERILIQSMLQTMYAHKGIGLAAPQVGINKKIFVADIGEGPVVVVNPHILNVEGAWKMEEGCLSIPGVSVEIERPKKIIVEYTDENNKLVKCEMDEMMARVFLHENDHLEGKLILDYLSDEDREKAIQAFTKAIEEEKA